MKDLIEATNNIEGIRVMYANEPFSTVTNDLGQKMYIFTLLDEQPKIARKHYMTLNHETGEILWTQCIFCKSGVVSSNYHKRGQGILERLNYFIHRHNKLTTKTTIR